MKIAILLDTNVSKDNLNKVMTFYSFEKKKKKRKNYLKHGKYDV